MVDDVQPPQKRSKPRVARRKDVAELAGVSPSTVSLVLNNTPGPRIPDSTRQRIIDAANQLGYQPNAVARALVTGKTMTIGVVFHYIGNPFHETATNWLNGVWKTLQLRDYRLLIGEGVEDKPLAGMYRQRGVDGLIILVPPTQPHDDDKEMQQMIDADFPVVSIGSHFKQQIGDYVDTDNRRVARTMTEKLIEAGHKRIAHITGPMDVNSSAVDRFEGYKEALAKHNLPYDESLIVYANYTPDVAIESLKKKLDEKVEFTAMFSANASMAHGAIRTLRERGLNVPDDVSVTAIDLPFQQEPIDYELVTYHQSLSNIGVRATELLLERIESDDVMPPRTEFVDGTFIQGNTIRKR